jgi:ADP-ribosyltransferase exoenzyme
MAHHVGMKSAPRRIAQTTPATGSRSREPSRSPSGRAGTAQFGNGTGGAGGLAGVDLLSLQQSVGNQAVAGLVRRQAAPVGPIFSQSLRPLPPPTAADSPDWRSMRESEIQIQSATMTINAPDLVNTLERAINQNQPDFKSGEQFVGARGDDQFHRMVDYKTVVKCLTGLTADEVRLVLVLYSKSSKSALRGDLLGKGMEGRFESSLTHDQRTRIDILLQGTAVSDIKDGAQGAENRHHLNIALEISELASAGLRDRTRRERVMTLLRRPKEENDKVLAAYAATPSWWPGSVNDLMAEVCGSKGVQGEQSLRAWHLRNGNTVEADQTAISEITARVAAEEKRFDGFTDLEKAFTQNNLKSSKKTALGQIDEILELNRNEAVATAEGANSGVGPTATVNDRMTKLLGGDGTQPGVGAAVATTFGPAGAQAIAAATANPSRWVAQLLRMEAESSTTTAKIAELLQGIREQATSDVREALQAKKALLTDVSQFTTLVDLVAKKAIADFQIAYDEARGKGRSFDAIVKKAEGANEDYLVTLTQDGGQIADKAVALDIAIRREKPKDILAILQSTRNGEEMRDVEARYNKTHKIALREALTGPTEMFGLKYNAGALGGALSGLDALGAQEQLDKPLQEEMGTFKEVMWIAKWGLEEYQYARDNDGLAGTLREIGDDPETLKILEATAGDLPKMARYWVDANGNEERRAKILAAMRKIRLTLTNDAEAYDKENDVLRGQLAMVLQLALAVAIPGGGGLLVSIATNIASSIAVNALVYGSKYTPTMIQNDLLGGIAGPLGGLGATAVGAKVLQKFTAGFVAKVQGSVWKAVAQGAGKEVAGFIGSTAATSIVTGQNGFTLEDGEMALLTTFLTKGKEAAFAKPGAPGSGGKVAPNAGDSGTPDAAVVGKPLADGGPDANKAPLPDGVPPLGATADGALPTDAGQPQSIPESLGMSDRSAAGLQEVVDMFNLRAEVRGTNLDSPRGEGYIPKPEAMKAKTGNDIDVQLGGPPSGVGLVMIFDPVLPANFDSLPPEVQAKVAKRFKDRKEEFDTRLETYKDLLQDTKEKPQAMRIVDGVVEFMDPRSGKFSKLSGDHDIYALTTPDGASLPSGVRQFVYTYLRSLGLGFEHGAHLEWLKDATEAGNPKSFKPSVDAKIRSDMQVEPRLVFDPQTPVTTSIGDPALRPEPVADGRDPRMPIAEAQVVPDAPRGPKSEDIPGETDFSVDNSASANRPNQYQEVRSAIDAIVANLDSKTGFDGDMTPGTPVKMDPTGLIGITTNSIGDVTHQMQGVTSAQVHDLRPDGSVAGSTDAGPSPKALTVDERALTANMAEEDYLLRPKSTGGLVDVTAGSSGESIAVPSAGAVRDGRVVVGGQEGSTLNTSQGEWDLKADGTSATDRRIPQQFDVNAPGDFQMRSAAELAKWEAANGPLTTAQHHALWYYSDDGSTETNRFLRGLGSGGGALGPTLQNALAHDIDAAMRPIPQDIRVKRMVGIEAFGSVGVRTPEDLKAAIGRDYSDPGVISTSILGGKWSGGILMEIDAPAGTRARYIGPDSPGGPDPGSGPMNGAQNPLSPTSGAISNNAAEFELMLERGTTFQIQSVTEPSNSGEPWTVHVRVTRQGPT